MIDINGNRFSAAAALPGSGFVPRIGQEMLARCQQEGTESALFSIHQGQEMLFQQASEKLLRQILRFLRGKTLPPNEDIQRIPVGAAQGSERFLSLRRRLP